MNHRLLTIAASAAMVLATSCSDTPTIDAHGTDDERRASIQAVRASLPEEIRDDFDEALATLIFSDVNDLGDLLNAERRFGEHIHGKTGEQVIADARIVREQAARRERESALAEIRRLVATLDAYDDELLAHFVIERARHSRSEYGFMGSDSRITLEVRNETGRAVARAHFRALLLTPGRAIPWVDEGLVYEIPGGLEPGESARWDLTPNMFGDWDRAPTDRHDTVLIVRTVDLDGPDGTSLVGERPSERDVERLRSLLETVDYDGEDERLALLDERERSLARWRDTAARDATLDEVATLRAAKARATAAVEDRALFEVRRSRFLWSEGAFGRPEPVIELTLRNGTDETVTRFYAHGVLSSPGRELPWLEEDFNYEIRGGMEPGSMQRFSLSPNMFGSWSDAPRDRHDLVLTTTIRRVEGPNGEKLFQADWDADDETRLAALERLISEHGWR